MARKPIPTVRIPEDKKIIVLKNNGDYFYCTQGDRGLRVQVDCWEGGPNSWEIFEMDNTVVKFAARGQPLKAAGKVMVDFPPIVDEDYLLDGNTKVALTCRGFKFTFSGDDSTGLVMENTGLCVVYILRQDIIEFTLEKGNEK